MKHITVVRMQVTTAGQESQMLTLPYIWSTRRTSLRSANDVNVSAPSLRSATCLNPGNTTPKQAGQKQERAPPTSGSRPGEGHD